MRTLHLFAGAGGGLLADLILGHTPVAAVEWDAYCCQVLRERAEEGWFPSLRVHEGDIRLFDPSEYAGRVDCIAAGFPCTDLSVAGNQAGIAEGTRSGLWSEVVRVARAVRPRLIWLENVAAIISMRPGLDVVLADLADLGMDARWCCLRASDAGANHRRDRWWCLAYTDDGRREIERQPEHAEQQGARGRESDGLRETGRWAGADVADAERSERRPHSTDSARGNEAPAFARDGGPHDAYTISERSQRLSEGRPAPRPVDRSSNGSDPGWWEVEPDVGRVVDVLAARVDRLKALGNGQVPIQAALAWRILTA